MAAKPSLLRRQRAVEKVQARFAGKSFMLGRRDCIRLASVLLTTLGHKVPAIPAYKTEFMAVRRLKEHGAGNVADLLDSIGLARIPPAAALMGDLIFLPGTGASAIGALCTALGNGAMLGFHEDHVGLVSLRPSIDLDTAWSVLP